MRSSSRSSGLAHRLRAGRWTIDDGRFPLPIVHRPSSIVYRPTTIVFLSSIKESIRAIWRGVRAPGFYFALAFSLTVWTLAYQYKTVYTVDLGGTTDNAYVSGFNDKEHNQILNFRWSEASSEVRFPGVGNQPVVLSITAIGFRPSGESPAIQMEARGFTFTLQTRSETHTDTFFVARGRSLDGDFTVTITSPTFSPPNDPRVLGIIVDKVSVSPAGYGLRPAVVPSPGTLAGLLFGVVGVYLAFVITTRRVQYGLWAAIASTIVGACLIVFVRPEGALLAVQLPSLWAWGLLLALFGRATLDMLLRSQPGPTGFAVSMGSAAFVLAFLLRFGGMTYPQFLSSDLGLHEHNVQSVLNGQWVFTEPLPDGTLVPYPNAFYVVLAPLASVLGTSDEAIGLLLKWSGSLLDAATCLALAWAGTRLWGGRTAGIAALVYAVSPAPFILFSAGNYSNLFGQAMLNLTLLGGMGFVGRWTMDDGRWKTPPIVHRPSSIVLLTFGFTLTTLGHYGMMLAALSIIMLFGLWAGWESLRRGRATAAWTLVGAFGVALVASFALYYWRFTGEMWSQWSGAFRRLAGNKVGSAQAVGTTQSGNALINFVAKRSGWIGQLPVITATCGATQAVSLKGTARALLVSWLVAAAAFALLDQTLGDTIRWYYLGAAPVALLAGRYLGLLSQRGKVAQLLAAFSLLVMLFYVLTFWVGDLIFTRYH